MTYFPTHIALNHRERRGKVIALYFYNWLIFKILYNLDERKEKQQCIYWSWSGCVLCVKVTYYITSLWRLFYVMHKDQVIELIGSFQEVPSLFVVDFLIWGKWIQWWCAWLALALLGGSVPGLNRKRHAVKKYFDLWSWSTIEITG